MTVDIEAGPARRRMDVRRAGKGWVITFDGRERYAELAPADGRWSLLIGEGPAATFALRDTVDGSVPKEAGQYVRIFKSYEIAIEARGRGERAIHVNGHVVPVSIAGARALFERRGRDASAGGGAGSLRIVTPMPGRIVKVFVKAGDPVTDGQGLLVVEAMKMENEVRAPKAGTIAEVHVSEGMLVEANTLLVRME